MQSVSAFCESENIKDIDQFMYLCFKQGFDIKKYGLLGETLNEGEEHLIKEVIVEKQVIKEVIVEITEKMLGVTAVVENNIIVGIITDGDLRRMLTKVDTFKGLTAKDIMSLNPKKISNDAMAVEAMEIMDTFGITQILAEENGQYCGVVHIHNLTKEGII